MNTRQLTRTVRTTLPEEVVERIRSVALHTGRATAGVRMTPAFIVVGAQRCGTTTLFRLLSEHPHLVRPTLSKGTGYFDDHYDRGWRWYQGHFPVRSLPGMGRAQPSWTFECSGYYLYHPRAAMRIARDLPGVQVVVMVRNPAERAWSAYRHEVARGFESLSFADAVALEGARTRGEGHRLRTNASYRSFAHRHHSYLQRGEYAHQIQRFHDALGADRVHVVDADSFFADQNREFTALQRHLGLPTWLPVVPQHWNARPGHPLPPEHRERLMRHFEASDERLAHLLGQQPSWRRSVGS